MAIYRPPKPRWPLAVGVGLAGLVIGLLIGLALGSREPEPQEIAGDLRADLVAASGSLEVAEIEYAESVSNGEVTKEAEYEGSIGALDSSEARYREVAPAIEALAPSLSGEIAALYDECMSAMRAREDATDVGECLRNLQDLLEGES